MYDVLTLEPSAIVAIAERLGEAVLEPARHLLDIRETDGWTEDMQKQLMWPADLGGMGFGSATLAAKIGRLAALAQCLPTARQHLRTIAPEASEQEILAAVPLAEAQATLEWLKAEYDIEISAGGNIAADREPRLRLHADFKPVTGPMGKLTQAVFKHERAKMLEQHAQAEAQAKEAARRVKRTNPEAAKQLECKAASHQRHLVRLRSVAGEGVHACVEECPKSGTLSLNDAEFNFAIRYRMGLAVLRPGLCQLHSCDGDDRCGCGLDAFGDHALLCHKGRGRYRVHGALCKCLTRFAKQSCVEAETEVCCPQLLQGEPGSSDCVEARMDVHLWAYGDQLYEEWVDVTVTNPFAKRQRQAAAVTDGVAAEKAEGRKLTRYGSGAGGVVVAPAGFESWGRLGGSCRSVLARLAAQRCSNSPTDGAHRRIVQRWLSELGVA